jgi:hypothetical protein
MPLIIIGMGSNFSYQILQLARQLDTEIIVESLEPDVRSIETNMLKLDYDYIRSLTLVERPRLPKLVHHAKPIPAKYSTMPKYDFRKSMCHRRKH